MGLFYDPSALLGHISEMVRSAELQNAGLGDVRATFCTFRVAHSWSQSLRRSLDRDAKLCTAHDSYLLQGQQLLSQRPILSCSPSLESLPPRT